MPRYDNIPEIAPSLDGSGLKVGIVMCRFNLDVCEGLLSSCSAELLRLGVAASDITIATVPGALEAPLTLQVMAKSGRFDALVALGAVIRGETYHFEIVANESARGVSEVALEFGIPVGNGILTCDTDEQALARMDTKGYEAAQAALEVANTLHELEPR